jgi:hypothetical protein
MRADPDYAHRFRMRDAQGRALTQMQAEQAQMQAEQAQIQARAQTAAALQREAAALAEIERLKRRAANQPSQ